MNRPSPARVQVPGPLEAYAGSFREGCVYATHECQSRNGHDSGCTTMYLLSLAARSTLRGLPDAVCR